MSAVMHAEPGAGRLLLAAAALFVVWAWMPEQRDPLPAHVAEPADADALAALPADTAFLLAGTLEVSGDATAPPWQGRDVYVHRARRDHGGHGSSRHLRVDVVAQRRPAVRFHWAGGTVDIAADSYRLEHAPRIEPADRGDRWDRSSRGFRDGDTALALGRTGDDGRYWVESLLQWPLYAVQGDIASEHRKRMRLVIAAKIVATLFVLALLSPQRGADKRRRAPTVSR